MMENNDEKYLIVDADYADLEARVLALADKRKIKVLDTGGMALVGGIAAKMLEGEMSATIIKQAQPSHRLSNMYMPKKEKKKAQWKSEIANRKR